MKKKGFKKLEKLFFRRFWLLTIVVIMVALTGMVLLLLRGDEDTWIKDDSGNWVKHGSPTSSAPVTSFDECAKLYPVVETYPEQCKTPDGKSFTKPY
jgi:hypothetical protein